MAIGICKIDKNGNIIELQRGALFQGWGFKDKEAFEHYPDAPCYVPELFDIAYTRNDILMLCDNQVDIAHKIFVQLDWQSPETLIDEELREGELTICKNCNRMFISYQNQKCLHCGVQNSNI